MNIRPEDLPDPKPEYTVDDWIQECEDKGLELKKVLRLVLMAHALEKN